MLGLDTTIIFRNAFTFHSLYIIMVSIEKKPSIIDF